MIRDARSVTALLRARGELWESAPGLTGMRGPLLALRDALERTLAGHAAHDGAEAWRPPAAVRFETLARADYFACFPQWLTAASHLGDDASVLEAVAGAADPATAARRSLQPAAAALPPAACYHVYAALDGARLAAPLRITLQCTCWRHEGARHAPLARGWAFTMREIVRVAEPAEVEAFRQHELERARALAASLGLRASIAAAADPFFLPAARGKALLQRLKGLKHELRLDIGGGESVAAASFNHHDRFFGDAFDIRLADGLAAATGCAAFGVERWLLAFLVAHGVEPAGWPALRPVHAPEPGVFA